MTRAKEKASELDYGKNLLDAKQAVQSHQALQDVTVPGCLGAFSVSLRCLSVPDSQNPVKDDALADCSNL